MASSPSLEFLSPINLQSPAQSPQPLRNTLDDGQSMDRNTDREPSTSVASEKSSDLYPGSVSITATLNGISVDKTRDAAIDKDHIGTDSGKSAYEFVRYGEVDRNRKYIYEDEDNSDFTAIAETRSINSLGLEPTQVHTQHTEISIASGSSTNTNRADSKHDAHNKVSCMSGSQLLKKQTSKSHLHTVTQTNSPAYAYQSLDFEPYTGPPTAPKRHNTLPEIQPQATRTTKVRTETRSPPQAYLQTLASEHSSVLSPTPQLGDSDVLLGSGPDYSMDNRSASNDIIPMSTAEFAALHNSLMEFKHQKYAADATNASLQKQIDSLQNKNPKKAKVLAAEAESCRLRKELGIAWEEHMTTRAELNDLQDTVVSQKNTFQSNIIALTTDNTELRATNTLLAVHIRALGETSAEAALLTKSFNYDLEGNIVRQMNLKALETKLIEKDDAVIAAEEQIRILTKTNNELGAQLASVMSDARERDQERQDAIDKAAKKLESLKLLENDYNTLLAGLKDQLKAKDDAYHDMNMDLTLITKQLSAAQSNARMKESELDLTKKELGRLKHLSAVLPKYEQELEAVKKDYTTMSTENLCLTDSLHQLKQTGSVAKHSMTAEIKHVKAELAHRTAELEWLQQEMDKEKQRRQAEQGEVLSRKSQADAELAEAQARLKAVDAQIEKITSERRVWEEKTKKLKADFETIASHADTNLKALHDAEEMHRQKQTDLQATHKQERKKDAALIKDLRRMLQQAVDHGGVESPGLVVNGNGNGNGSVGGALPYSFEKLLSSTASPTMEKYDR